MLALEFSGLNSSIKGLKFIWWWCTAPNEGDGEERDGYRLCILGDLNRRIGERTIAGITGAFGAPGENANGRRVVEFC